MRKRKQKFHQEEINFWQSSSDLMTGLLLILLLVIILLVLFLLQLPDQEFVDMWAGGGITELTTDWATEMTTVQEDEDDKDSGRAGDGGDRGREYETTTTTTTERYVRGGSGGGGGIADFNEEEEGEFPEWEEGPRAAVYAMLVDGDTGNTIKNEGVAFSLFSLQGEMQVLSTYYPERIAYRDFVTTQTGTFYLPEKIPLDGYYFHELSEVEGYDLAEDVSFWIDDEYDWPEPFVVRIPIYPARNIVRVQMVDAESGDPVPGGTFNVVADEDVITLDGTLRHRAGEAAGEIECNEEGYGESNEVYLGNYHLIQDHIPDYYASIQDEDSLVVAVEKKSVAGPSIHELQNERTKITLTLSDEVLPATKIRGAVFTVTSTGSSAKSRTYTTDNRGQIILDELNKSTTYRIRQLSSVSDYYMDDGDYEFFVDSEGRIEGEAQAELDLTNWILRVSIGVTDGILRNQVSDVNLALYTATGQMIRTWTTSGTPEVITNLDEGTYYVIKDGNQARRYEIKVSNKKDIQQLNIQIWTLKGIGLSATIIAAAAGSVYFLVMFIRKRRNKKTE
ncbi:MAG: hypothetical protein IKE03_09485 [Blautia sp.]|nr:hypothetical protein [Blautia sp.]